MFNIINLFIKASHKEYSVFVRAIATILGAAVFLAGFPAFSLWMGRVFLSDPVFPILAARVLSVASGEGKRHTGSACADKTFFTEWAIPLYA